MRKKIFSWPAMATACVLMFCVFFAALYINAEQGRAAAATRASLQIALTKAEQDALSLRKAINNVGSDSYVESMARASLNYMKQGELRFEVVNSELLGNYTPEELQILADEMAQPDR